MKEFTERNEMDAEEGANTGVEAYGSWPEANVALKVCCAMQDTDIAQGVYGVSQASNIDQSLFGNLHHLNIIREMYRVAQGPSVDQNVPSVLQDTNIAQGGCGVPQASSVDQNLFSGLRHPSIIQEVNGVAQAPSVDQNVSSVLQDANMAQGVYGVSQASNRDQNLFGDLQHLNILQHMYRAAQGHSIDQNVSSVLKDANIAQRVCGVPQAPNIDENFFSGLRHPSILQEMNGVAQAPSVDQNVSSVLQDANMAQGVYGVSQASNRDQNLFGGLQHLNILQQMYGAAQGHSIDQNMSSVLKDANIAQRVCGVPQASNIDKNVFGHLQHPNIIQEVYGVSQGPSVDQNVSCVLQDANIAQGVCGVPQTYNIDQNFFSDKHPNIIQEVHGVAQSLSVEQNVPCVLQNPNVAIEVSSSVPYAKETTEKPIKDPVTIHGRRIIDVAFFLKTLKDLNKHSKSKCDLNDMVIKREKRRGLVTCFYMKCVKCKFQSLVWSEDPEKENQNINAEAVAGMFSISGNYWNLRELFANLRIPVMTKYRFNKEYKKISQELEKKFEKELETAVLTDSEITIQPMEIGEFLVKDPIEIGIREEYNRRFETPLPPREIEVVVNKDKKIESNIIKLNEITIKEEIVIDTDDESLMHEFGDETEKGIGGFQCQVKVENVQRSYCALNAEPDRRPSTSVQNSKRKFKSGAKVIRTKKYQRVVKSSDITPVQNSPTTAHADFQRKFKSGGLTAVKKPSTAKHSYFQRRLKSGKLTAVKKPSAAKHSGFQRRLKSGGQRAIKKLSTAKHSDFQRGLESGELTIVQRPSTAVHADGERQFKLGKISNVRRSQKKIRKKHSRHVVKSSDVTALQNTPTATYVKGFKFESKPVGTASVPGAAAAIDQENGFQSAVGTEVQDDKAAIQHQDESYRRMLAATFPKLNSSETDTSDFFTLQNGGTRRLIQDFILPALQEKTFGDLLKWDPEEPSVFMLRWVHKAKSSWSELDSALFREWDRFKGRPVAKTHLEVVNSKQRLRAALRHIKNIKEVPVPARHAYRKYRILKLRNFAQRCEKREPKQHKFPRTMPGRSTRCRGGSKRRLKSSKSRHVSTKPSSAETTALPP